jgi:hypothetical protein
MEIQDVEFARVTGEQIAKFSKIILSQSNEVNRLMQENAELKEKLVTCEQMLSFRKADIEVVDDEKG